jgi:hypothetical protein
MRPFLIAVCLLVLVSCSACQKEQTSEPSATPPAPPPSQAVPPPEIKKIEATPEAVAQANKDFAAAAERARKMRAALTFEEFRANVYREPFEGGKYIVDGDTVIPNDKQLQEFYENHVKPVRAELAVATVNGLDAKWNQQLKTQLTYCVSTTFGSRHDAVVQEMANATGAWEKVAAVDFSHVPAADATCGPSNQNVVFDVRPVNVGQYLARAFFPNEPRSARNVLIDESSFELDPTQTLKLVGILRHELGHSLGFRHEHTRPEAGTCFEDNDFRPLTNYDAFSVMHYPQCNGLGDWSLNLTNRDKSGSACLYGPASGFTVDPTLVKGPCAMNPVAPSPGTPTTQTFTGQSVMKNAQKPYGPFAVKAGSQLEVVMNGPGASGDPDLYVRFDAAPTRFLYDCRPYLDGPVESCALTVPATAKQVHVMVRGYAAGTYELRVTRVAP